MSDESELLKKRFVELAKKSYNCGIYTFTDFLGLAEQSLFDSVKNDTRGIPYTIFGGTDGCERVMVRFGSEEECGYDMPFPIATVKFSPVSPKFSDKLTHRDFLGAILNLGIERKLVGDIVIRDNVGYVFLRDDIAEYVRGELSRIKHTDVRAELIDELPEGDLYKTETRRVQANGERLDAIVAKVFCLSREDAQRLFVKGFVFIGGRETQNTSVIPKVGDVISVRGYGRMIYRGYDSLTRKGKLNILVDVYV